MDNVLPFAPPIVLGERDEHLQRVTEVRLEVIELSLLQLRYVVGFLMEENLDQVAEAVDAAREAFVAF